MLATRQALTALLQATPAVTALLGYVEDAQGRRTYSVLQEDELTKETKLPAVVLAFDGSERYGNTRAFRRERWDLWLLTESGDYFTLGQLADTLRAALDGSGLDVPAGRSAAGLDIEWVYDGPAVPDREYGLHTQVQRYWVLSQTITP